MPTEIIAALISSTIGGLIVAIINLFFTRRKIDAEIKKLEAESRKANLEAEEIERKRNQELLESICVRAAEKALERFLEVSSSTTIQKQKPYGYVNEINEDLLKFVGLLISSYLEQQEQASLLPPSRRKTK